MYFLDCHQVIKKFLNDNMTDYILLDLPYYSNVGDVLIWQSTLDILNDLPYKCLYSSAIETYYKPKIKDDVLIVFLGGGNFGDLWERHQIFRYRVMTDFPNNPVLQLPQSVCFESGEKMKRDIDFFAKHKGKVTICLREKKSYDLIASNYKNVHAVLLPDMVLAFDVDKYCKKHNINIEKGCGRLLVQRKDKERTLEEIDATNFSKVADWPSMEVSLPEMCRFYKINNLIVRLHMPLYIRNKIMDYYFKYIMKKAFLKSGILFLMSYEVIYSTRLHAAILACLLGKRTYIIDNSYGKCRGVYETWMTKCENIDMI